MGIQESTRLQQNSKSMRPWDSKWNAE